MLYDNAQPARAYLHAWQLTGNEFFRKIAEEALDYVAREMRSPEGGFYSTQDADSKGVEGKFFAWTVDEIRDVLGDRADEFFLEDYVNLAEALLALYQATFDPRWYQAAHGLVDLAMARFWERSNASGIAGFYDTATVAEQLIARPRDLQDKCDAVGDRCPAR